jgi:aminomethyltransferase
MNHFKDAYQSAVIANAKAFARALADCGLQVAGDPALGYTETHQVLVDVGYTQGPQIARRLEQSNIICNYQAGPFDESFSASGMLRMGVSEMTRFGMGPQGFYELAQLMREVIKGRKDVRSKVVELRQAYLEMNYCFSVRDFEEQLNALMAVLH